ncbi:MAG: single-stranded-DNA-specific exonuclease RecJ [Tissierellia bacterium]|nr:single-stranded-DNA-specific exonuclease RecJ [Tissierellia bacterium]
MDRWFLRNIKPKNKWNPVDYGITNLQYKLLLHRGLETPEEMISFLNPSLEDLHSPLLMKDMIKAGNLIIESIKSKKKIRIIGDYDADGVMSTVILMKGLQRLGAKVDYFIPHRVHDGYGINPSIVKKAKEDEISTIITCDNGIAAFEAAKMAKEMDISLIITDHHDVVKVDGKDVLPQCYSIINPKQEVDSYPFTQICGAAVAFKLISYLYTIHGQEEIIHDLFLSFVTIATICDVMPLINENRAIVIYGLESLEKSDNLGIKVLKEVANIDQKKLSVYDIGFIIGPMINSAGRLSDASHAVELFLTSNEEKAKDIGKKLYELNRERQKLTEIGLEKFEEQLQRFKNIPKCLILYEPNLHESIVGIIAGRLKERYYRPTIVFTDGKNSLKGSGRSIEEYNMVAEIGKYRKYLESFGGHPMAAGVSVKKEVFDTFRNKVIEEIQLKDEDVVKKIRLDASLNFSDITMDLYDNINTLEPFGTGNERPLFGTKNINILNMKLLGKNKNVLKFQLSDNGNVKEGILFHSIKEFFNQINDNYPGYVVEDAYFGRPNPIKMDIVYSIDLNTFNGNSTIQLVIKSFRF